MQNNTECTYKDCVHFEACNAWIRHGTTLYDDFTYSVKRCPYYVSNVHFQKIKHGKWKLDVDEADYEYGTCSICGYIEWNAFPRGDTPKYCPSCGARMNGRRK